MSDIAEASYKIKQNKRQKGQNRRPTVSVLVTTERTDKIRDERPRVYCISLWKWIVLPLSSEKGVALPLCQLQWTACSDIKTSFNNHETIHLTLCNCLSFTGFAELLSFFFSSFCPNCRASKETVKLHAVRLWMT